MARHKATDTLETELTRDDDGFCTLQVRAKRGEDTRDEDRITATLGRPTREAVEAERDALIEMVEDTAACVRAIQPETPKHDGGD